MKRANGTGTIEILPDGRARVRVTVHRQRRSKIFDDAEVGQRMLEAFTSGVIGGDIEAPTGLPFSRVFDDYMDQRELSGRVRGIATERRLANAHIRSAPFFAKALDVIRRRDIDAWIDRLLATKAMRIAHTGKGARRRDLGRTLSRQTVIHAFGLVRRAFDRAVALELLKASPCVGAKVPRHVRAVDAKDKWTFLTAEEIALLFASPLSERDRALYTLAVYGGLRQGELFALRWEDVREQTARPMVVVRYGRNGPTKSGRVREVPLFEPARAALARWREESLGKAEGLVFPNPDGRMYGKTYYAGWFDKRERVQRRLDDGSKLRELVTRPGVKTRAGIARAVRFHDLRHTCASHLAMGTWDEAWSLEEIRDVLGHSSVTVTEIYAHLSPSALHDKARRTATTVGQRWLGGGEKSAAETGPIFSESFSERAIGFEPTTCSLGRRTARQPSRDDSTAPGQPRPTGDRREAIVDALERGDADWTMLDEVAALCPETREQRLAREIRERGPFAARAAIELLRALGPGRAAVEEEAS
jgi:integrase